MGLPQRKNTFQKDTKGREIFCHWLAMTELDAAYKGRVMPFFHLDHVPNTQGELARLLGLGDMTLSLWKYQDDIVRRVARLKKKMSAEYLRESLITIDTVLKQKAEKGDLRAMELYYQQIKVREGWDQMNEEELQESQTQTKEDAIEALRDLLAENTEYIEIDESDAKVKHFVEAGSDESTGAYSIYEELTLGPDATGDDRSDLGGNQDDPQGEAEGTLED